MLRVSRMGRSIVWGVHQRWAGSGTYQCVLGTETVKHTMTMGNHYYEDDNNVSHKTETVQQQPKRHPETRNVTFCKSTTATQKTPRNTKHYNLQVNNSKRIEKKMVTENYTLTVEIKTPEYQVDSVKLKGTCLLKTRSAQRVALPDQGKHFK